MSNRTQKATKSAASPAGPQEYRKPQADVYTVLLVIALAMLITATAALWMTMKDDYNNEIKGGPTVWHRPAAGTTIDVLHGIV